MEIGIPRSAAERLVEDGEVVLQDENGKKFEIKVKEE